MRSPGAQGLGARRGEARKEEPEGKEAEGRSWRGRTLPALLGSETGHDLTNQALSLVLIKPIKKQIVGESKDICSIWPHWEEELKHFNDTPSASLWS